MSISIDPKKIKALALDLDGTLLAPGSVLSDRTVRAVEAAKQRGIKVIIATGRAIESTEPFRAALGLEGPMIYYNGAIIMDMPGRKILSSTLLDKKAAEFCVDLAGEMGVYYQAFLSGDGPGIRLMTAQDLPGREMYYKHCGLLAELADLKEVLRSPEVKGCVKTMFLTEPEVQVILRPRLEEHFGDSVYIAQTLRNFLEVMNKNVSKGQALKFFMEKSSIKPEELIAIGDDENDIPMFSAAAYSAAPSGAKDSVKAAATMVIGSNAEDGVAKFMEEFFGL